MLIICKIEQSTPGRMRLAGRVFETPVIDVP